MHFHSVSHSLLTSHLLEPLGDILKRSTYLGVNFLWKPVEEILNPQNRRITHTTPCHFSTKISTGEADEGVVFSADFHRNTAASSSSCFYRS